MRVTSPTSITWLHTCHEFLIASETRKLWLLNNGERGCPSSFTTAAITLDLELTHNEREVLGFLVLMLS